LPIVLGIMIALAAAACYWMLEVLLASYADYARGLWEGAAVVTTINGGNMLVNLVFKRVDACKKEKLS
jgi:hypothetical protein